MLALFDYICRCKTGSELYGALKIKNQIKQHLDDQNIGVPCTAVYGPCQRCWIYDCNVGEEYCPLCNSILEHSQGHNLVFQDITLIWYDFDLFPTSIEKILPEDHIGFIPLNYRSGLIMCMRSSIQNWLRSLTLKYGSLIKGLLQIFPTMGQGNIVGMGDILSTAKSQSKSLQFNNLWVRFYPEAWQLLDTKRREELGILTFEISDFISLIEKSKIYKEVIPNRFRNDIFELITKQDIDSESYYWGKLKRSLNKKAIDLIDSWKLKNWDKNKVELLYELSNYTTY